MPISYLPTVERQPATGTFVWEPRPEPVLGRGAGGFDAVDALNPSVVKQDGTYLNFYSGYDGKTWHTGLATSTDGVVWANQGRVLSPEGWEGDYIAANGSALPVGTSFLYWYQAGRTPRIALARSSDGRTWSRHGSPVVDLGPRGSWDERGVADPYVVTTAASSISTTSARTAHCGNVSGVARSSDGVVWTKLRANPILDLGEYGAFDENGLGEPAVWYSNGSYWMLYTGRDRAENRRTGLARSQDGVHWTKLPTAASARDRCLGFEGVLRSHRRGDGRWRASMVWRRRSASSR